MTITPDLIAFLSARLDEDEAAAQAVDDNSAPWDGRWQPRGRHALETHNGWVLARAGNSGHDFRPGVVEHMARHDPARVLREVEAKRKILAEHKAVTRLAALTEQELGFLGWYREWVLKNLAAAWNDHPDYRQEWGTA